ncbi:bacteriorhodopsin [Nocardioides xinjiangensis]|uniref:bacteriorhodopsin n=1 Tax=Nocardioides xinjiangensis TaxID=2817376 RepID=UPI001B300B1E|nr:bacteriorhodopsin [Nocardioides sp. SYSU D00778]
MLLASSADVTAPEKVVLSSAQHDLIVFSIVVAGFALFAHFLYNWNSMGEVSSRYRPAVLASLCIAGVATLSYLMLFLMVDSGYDYSAGSYVPNPEALSSITSRYMDWAVTVPLLMAELLAVCTLVGRKLAGTRAVVMAAAFAMIVTGYLGDQVFKQGESTFWLWLWWGISMACFVVIYVVLVPAVVTSVRSLPEDVGRGLSQAATVLLSVFFVYPIVYLIPIFFDGGWWTTTIHVAFSAADVIAKVGFGMLVHKVAKLRTAADVAAGDETHPEPVWVNSVHHSDGVQPAQRPFEEWPHRRGDAHRVAGAHGATAPSSTGNRVEDTADRGPRH